MSQKLLHRRKAHGEIIVQKGFFQPFWAGISNVSTNFLLFGQENLPQRTQRAQRFLNFILFAFLAAFAVQ
jgi:hypothetical protein